LVDRGRDDVIFVLKQDGRAGRRLQSQAAPKSALHLFREAIEEILLLLLLDAAIIGLVDRHRQNSDDGRRI
jgi:hypothetical protein